MSEPDSIIATEAERRRRQRGRNLAILAVLAGIVILIYAVTIVKIKAGWRP
jgi:hypothetical protein